MPCHCLAFLRIGGSKPRGDPAQFWEPRHSWTAIACAHFTSSWLSLLSLKRKESWFHLPKWLVNYIEDFENSNCNSSGAELSLFVILVHQSIGFCSRPRILWGAFLEPFWPKFLWWKLCFLRHQRVNIWCDAKKCWRLSDGAFVWHTRPLITVEYKLLNRLDIFSECISEDAYFA